MPCSRSSRALASFHDANGDVVVPGLRREEWTGASFSDEEFRELAEIEPGVPFIGTGGLGERLWSGPAITVTGIDVLPVDKAVNAVVPSARAKISMRIHPEQDPAEAQAALVRHLESVRPFGIELEVEAAADRQGLLRGHVRAGVRRCPRGARERLGSRVGLRRDRWLDPTVSALSEAAPDAEILLFGTTDGFANIHAPNERVLLDEFEKAVLAEAEFFGLYADAFSGGSTSSAS